MKIFTIILGILFLLACSKSENQSPCSRDFGTINSTGEKISSIVTTYNGVDSRTTSFIYSDEDQLLEIENYHSIDLTVLEYSEELVSTIKYYYDTSSMMFYSDSLRYDPQHKLVTRFRYESDSIESNKLNYTENYEYNSDGDLIKKTKIDSDPDYEYNSFEKYRWENGNLVHKECHDFNQGLQYEYFYEYDNEINYKLQILHQEWQAQELSRNNLLSLTYKDYVGNLDLFCGYCCSNYTYNQDGYPVRVLYTNSVTEIIYE